MLLNLPQSLTPTALRLLSREIVTLRKEPPEGVRIVVDEDDLSELEGWVQGPGEYLLARALLVPYLLTNNSWNAV